MAPNCVRTGLDKLVSQDLAPSAELDWAAEMTATTGPTVTPPAEHPGGLDWAGEVTATTGPTLLLLGPIRLRQAAGQRPARAERSCLEYLAWLLDHPGASSVLMTRDLMVAEGTRRSNLSRLRAWLGRAPDGSLYLPEAYSGRLHLHPTVTSDWQRFDLLVAHGVAATPTDRLIAALNLVRGVPLADASAIQWGWAEPARVDLNRTIRRAGAELAERALAVDDLDLARWAVARASYAGDDETLLRRRLEIERRAGQDGEVDRLVVRLWRRATDAGTSLAAETLALLQEVADRGPRLAFSGQMSLW